MRIVFMGTPEFAVPGLEILLVNNYDVVGVVTAPDKPRGRGQQISPTAVKEFALRSKLNILQPNQLSDPTFIAELRSLTPDLFVVVAFRILPQVVYSIPLKGAFNLHASLLPKFRGAAPINWAIIKGERETGVTTFFLEEKVDTGKIILQARVAIGENETVGELHDKLAAVGAEIVLQTVRLIELGKAQPRQQENAFATPAPKIFKDDCRIHWEQSTRSIHDFVRGLSPVPTAWTRHNGITLKVYRTLKGVEEQSDVHTGQVARVTNDELSVQSADGLINILEIQQEGRKRMNVTEFLRGYHIRQGDMFE